jgi:hypothetical protein
MKRDMDCLRALLLKIEELPSNGIWSGVEVEGYSPAQVAYHAHLAQDAKFIVARFLLDEADVFMVERLTYAGHEFLDAAREDKLWNKAKETVLKNAGTLTVESLKIALSMLMQKAAQGMIV